MFLNAVKCSKISLTVCCLFVVLQTVRCAPHLPVWVKNCPKSGPLPLDDCIVKRIRDAMPYLVPGVPKYRIQALDPLNVTSIAVNTGSKQIGLSLKLTNAQIFGLKNADYYKSKIDIPNRKWEIFYTNPRLEAFGHYKVDGKIIILPVNGVGPGNITLTDVSGHYTMEWDYYKRKGKQYARTTKSNMSLKVGKAYFQFKDLFNGDKALGAQMNSFLNENWAEVIKEFNPAFTDAFTQVFRQLIQNGFDQVPFDSFFPE